MTESSIRINGERPIPSLCVTPERARMVKIAFGVIAVGGFTVGILAIAGCLPRSTIFVGGGVFILALVPQAICSCKQKEEKPKSESPKIQRDTFSSAPSTSFEVKEGEVSDEGLVNYSPSQDTHLEYLTRVTSEDIRAFQDYQWINVDKNESIAWANGARFYYGNCDHEMEGGLTETGWGCAWRAIQTCASAFGLNYTFKSLYQKYSTSKNLERFEWAEPGTGKRFFDEMGKKAFVAFYKRDKGSDKTCMTSETPQYKDFSEFQQAVMQHFRKQQTPIMIDDGTYAYTILGMKITTCGMTILLIADPHKKTKKDGLYYLSLSAIGEKAGCTGMDNGANGLSSAQKIDPKKGWMLLFPGNEKLE